MFQFRKNITLFLLALLVFTGCNTKDKLAEPSDEFRVEVPTNLGPFPESERGNFLTKEGVELGEKLFFDPLLSKDNNISCATCHKPELAFSDGLKGSIGASGKTLERHTPTIMNLAWHDGFFWDGGANTLESQAFGPITHEDEMGQDLGQLMEELKADSLYPQLFENAFEEGGINSKNLSWALSQFQRSLITGNSPYDKYIRGEGNLSSLEKQGLQIYQENCSSCHVGDQFSDFGYHNNGLDEKFDYTSEEEPKLGRYRITFDSLDLGAYKTPTLRNIAVTAPYMHDGRFATLEEVLNHYNHGIKDSPSLAPKLKDGIQLTADEKTALIAFLKSLTDEEFLSRYEGK